MLNCNCKFGNFREIFFAKSVKIHICDVDNSRLWHYLALSLNDSDFAISRGFMFLENKTLAKISEFMQYLFANV